MQNVKQPQKEASKKLSRLKLDLRSLPLENRVFIDNLPISSSYNKIFSYFCRYVKVKKIKIWKEPAKDSAFCVLVTSHPSEAVLLSSFKNAEFKNRRITIELLDQKVQELGCQITQQQISQKDRFKLKPQIPSGKITAKQAILRSYIVANQGPDNLRFRINFNELKYEQPVTTPTA